MDALVQVVILDDNNSDSETSEAMINLNYMTRCVSTHEEKFHVYFTDGSNVCIHGYYEEFITLVKKMCPSHSFEEF